MAEGHITEYLWLLAAHLCAYGVLSMFLMELAADVNDAGVYSI